MGHGSKETIGTFKAASRRVTNRLLDMIKQELGVNKIKGYSGSYSTRVEKEKKWKIQKINASPNALCILASLAALIITLVLGT
jgi:hypothetical protein